ncbi:MAG: AAA family ATPase [Deltaproteobacteria bacterium]|nr:AAA family ATPase [Deltaproteobacteria bacterium]
MEALIKQKPISALHEILKWSASRPEWQRDALRRIIIKDALDAGDIKELNQLCRAKHGILQVTESIAKAEVLDESLIPPKSGSEASVTLVSIGNLQNVNRLPSDQTIPFGTGPSLTLIYGDNGTGKSGYARVIKKMCRTRGALPEIRPNAFAAVPTNPPSGTVVCRIAGTDYPLLWQDGTPSDPRLSNVFVFDTHTAEHYLEQDSPAVFTPNGLDVLPKLSNVCDSISQLIKQDIDRVKADIEAAAKNWKYNATTSVGKLLDGLSADTKPSHVEALSGLDERQNNRLKDLAEALKSDPKQKAKETRAAAARLNIFAGKIAETYTNLSVTQISDIHKLVEDAKEAEKVAKSFATGHFDVSYLSGTGEELWRSLWEAARSFSVSSAYKNQAFPVTADGARCVLCQQNLEPPAIDRLQAFDAFCKDQSQKLAEQARRRLKEAFEKIQKMEVLDPEYIKVQADLVAVTKTETNNISEFVKKADECLTTIKNNLKGGVWEEPALIPLSPPKNVEGIPLRADAEVALPRPGLADDITAIATSLEERANTEESAEDPEIRKKLVTERDELAAHDWLSGVKTDVLTQIDRYKQVVKLGTCQRDTLTTQITTKNSDLTKQIVTDTFCQRFKDEAKELGLSTISVKLEEIKGKKGEMRFGVRLDSNATCTVRDIASEGENRCIALAAFLAELSQASHQSALVFDDPVSSFDHRYREKTAARLVKEGKVRQVIVFTHDVVFLNDLKIYANDNEVPLEPFYLEWNSGRPGQCIKGLPWDWKSADDRFDKLEKEQRAIAKDWNHAPNEDNIQSIRQAYSWLRATLERIVEKEILADVVFRYRSYIDVKKLDRVVGFQESECKELQRLVKRCNDVTEAHDPAGKHAAVPSPDDFKAEIDATKQLVKQIRNRRKTE